VNRDTAIRYIKAGWHPLDLPERSKAPPPDGRTGYNGVDMTLDQVVAAAWAGNIGLRMPPDVIGLDVDAYRGGNETLQDLLNHLGQLPLTWIAHSGRNDGSGIRFFLVPSGLIWIHSLDGIEIVQRTHRYAVVWPSMHPDGRSYRWLDQSEQFTQIESEIPSIDDLPELPWSWIAHLSRTTAEETRSRAVDYEGRVMFFEVMTNIEAPGYLSVVETYFRDHVAAGAARHDTMQHCLIWACECAVARLFPATTAYERLGALWQTALVDEPKRAVLVAERPTEFEAMLRHAIGKALAKPDAEINRLHDEHAGMRIVSSSANGSTGTGGASQQIDRYQDALAGFDDDGTSFDPVDLAPYLAGTLVRVKADLVTMSDGRALLHCGRLNGLHGDSGAGKSMLMSFLTRELIDAGRTVMVLDLEDTPEPFIERLRQFGVSDADIERFVVFVRPEHAFSERNVARIIGHIVERSVAHIFIETLGEAFSLEGLNEDRDVDVAPWLRRVCRRVIEETGVGMTLVDHGTKSAERALDPSGSKRKRAAITGTAWLMRSVEPFSRTDGGMAELVCAKDRHGWYRRGDVVARLQMGAQTLSDGRSRLELLPAPVMVPVDPVAAVNGVLAPFLPDSLSLRQLLSAMRHAGVGGRDTELRDSVDLAVARHLIEEHAGPRRARMFRAKSTP